MNTNNDTHSLKTDALGRAHIPADRREAILDAFEQSGMSALAFSEQIGVKYPTFASWVQTRRGKRRKHSGSKLFRPPPSQITLVEAQIEQPPVKSCEGALEVKVSEGVTLLVRSQNDVTLAAELIRSLDGGQPC